MVARMVEGSLRRPAPTQPQASSPDSGPQTDAPRVYVNTKTRQPQPFFLHPCLNFDGAVMGIFPHRRDTDLSAFSDALNAVDWSDLGFVCDGRYIFTQRSLENAPLPDRFRAFLPDAA